MPRRSRHTSPAGSSRTTQTRAKSSPKRVPAYRLRKGYDQAIVTLTDAFTGRRRDYWLGEYESAPSRERYFQLLAEWEANDRRLPDPPGVAEHLASVDAGPTIAQILQRYRQSFDPSASSSERSQLRQVIRILRKLFGSTPARQFGPKRLRMVRDEMIHGDPDADPPRKPWSRGFVNKQTNRICAIFKWAAGQELVPVTVYQQLKTIESLKRGKTAAYDPEPVRPVPDERVDAIQPFVSRQVWALIQLQRYTAARGGELFQLRPKDIDTASEIWTYTPTEHKNAHRGHRRIIYFGPRAQQVLRPFLANRPADAYLFSPAEAEAERRYRMHAQRDTPLSCGNVPGSNRTDEPRRSPQDFYDKHSYNRAIARACDQAFPPPDDLARIRVPAHGRKADTTRWETKAEWRRRLGPARSQELKQWCKTHRWRPHQLRHTAATQIRREFGLEAAQIALGHSSALVTDAVYAERDQEKVIEVMKRAG